MANRVVGFSHLNGTEVGHGMRDGKIVSGTHFGGFLAAAVPGEGRLGALVRGRALWATADQLTLSAVMPAHSGKCGAWAFRKVAICARRSALRVSCQV
jgi:hypothetical protein